MTLSQLSADVDAIATAEQKVADLKAQINAERDLSTSLDFDEVGSSRYGTNIAMRANIITAPVFPSDAADGAAVVGMMVGGAGPLGGIPREEHPLALTAPAPAILASRNARHPSA